MTSRQPERHFTVRQVLGAPGEYVKVELYIDRTFPGQTGWQAVNAAYALEALVLSESDAPLFRVRVGPTHDRKAAEGAVMRALRIRLSNQYWEVDGLYEIDMEAD